METTVSRGQEHGNGTTEIVYILLVLQGAMGLLAALGVSMLTRGNPLALLAFGKPGLLFVLAVGLVHRWRLARVATIVVQGFSLLSFVANLLLGVVAAGVDFTINLVTLITNVALPIGILMLLTNRRLAAVDSVYRASGEVTEGVKR